MFARVDQFLQPRLSLDKLAAVNQQVGVSAQVLGVLRGLVDQHPKLDLGFVESVQRHQQPGVLAAGGVIGGELGEQLSELARGGGQVAQGHRVASGTDQDSLADVLERSFGRRGGRRLKVQRQVRQV